MVFFHISYLSYGVKKRKRKKKRKFKIPQYLKKYSSYTFKYVELKPLSIITGINTAVFFKDGEVSIFFHEEFTAVSKLLNLF